MRQYNDWEEIDKDTNGLVTSLTYMILFVNDQVYNYTVSLMEAMRNSEHYLMNPQFASSGSSIDNPCFTLIARMDKRPPHLVSPKTVSNLDAVPDFVKMDDAGNIYIEIYETDIPIIVKIKEFMAMYQIVDIMMRMLKIPELKRIMGFPENYKLIGTQAEQKKYIGNAVEVGMAKALCEALARKLIGLKSIAA